MIKISVIIPVYNVEKYLPSCLDSIINQTLEDIEIICVDDGSTDNSLKILKSYQEKDNRIKIITQENQYAGVARNNGMSVAIGKYFSFLDSDDFFEKTMLEEMYNRAEKDNSDVVVCGFYSYDNKNNTISGTSIPENKFVKLSPFALQQIKSDVFTFTLPNTWTKLFKKELFDKYKIKFDGTICSNDFSATYSLISLANKISIINKPLIYYRRNQNSSLTAKRKQNMIGFKSDLQAFNSLYTTLNKFSKYQEFRTPYINMAKRMFKKYDKPKCRVIAKKILSPSVYNEIFK